MLKTKVKSKTISGIKTHEKDTGSTSVQIALLTEQIKQLTGHLKKHTKDNHSRRGLLKMVSKRRKLLAYISKNEPEQYEKVIKKLGLRK
jgi:small subunit ribosomal protein S15